MSTMRKSIVREILLYKYRYGMSLLLFGICLMSLLLLRNDLAPGGLSLGDMNAAAHSAGLTLTQLHTSPIVDLPYHLIQKTSLHFLGITEFAVILPSIMFAIVTGATFLFMVYRWFQLNVALITGLIFITSATFLSIGRSGEPTIMTTFWLSILLLAATNVLHPEGKTRIWLLIAILILPLSLYTPLMIYPLIATGIAALLHPHVRFALRSIKPVVFIVASLYIATALIPLIMSCSVDPTQITTLLGLPSQPLTIQVVLDNARLVGGSLFNLWDVAIGIIPQPLLGAASLIIVLLGFLKTVEDRFSARAYMLLIWSGLMIPLIIVNPDKLLIFLIPIYLYLAIGIETLIREWYRLFPANPYARLTGLIPLVILLGGIMYSNAVQYFGGHFFGTQTTVYSQALRQTTALITSPAYKNKPLTVIVKPEETTFFNLLSKQYSNIIVASQAPSPVRTTTIIHDGAVIPTDYRPPIMIVPSHRTNEHQVVLRIFTP